MSVSPIETDFYGIWVDFAKIECDFCDAAYPPNGLLSEFPAVLHEARGDGWSMSRLTQLACCPDCHRRLFNEGEHPGRQS